MMLNPLLELPLHAWQDNIDPALQKQAQDHLEAGGVLYFPYLGFSLLEEEKRFLSPGWSDGKTKSIYLRGTQRSLRGFAGSKTDAVALTMLIERYAASARALTAELFPDYANKFEIANTSFRPLEAAGRAQSWRHDDSRLHTDAFPSRPTHGTRILHIFCNINPDGRPRHGVWANPLLKWQRALCRNCRLSGRG